MILQNKTAVIIGVGQIGGSLGLALKKANLFSEIYGYDKNAQRLKLSDKFLDKCFNEVGEAIDKSDVVILASPINDILRTLKLGFENFPNKLYTDVGSTKSPMMELSKKYQNIRYVAGHPLAGSEKKGESGWATSLFSGKPYFWITNENQNKEDEQFVVKMIKAIGANPISISAEEHDRAVAMTSHLSLLLSLAIMSSFSERIEQLAPFIGTGFKSVARLAGGSPEMGKDLLLSNRENILKELEKFSAKMSELKELLVNIDEIPLLNKMRNYQELYWQTIENFK